MSDTFKPSATNLPEFFKSAKLPAVAKWAMDKTTEHRPYDLEIDGRKVIVRSWFFEGKFPRPGGNVVSQWDCPESGTQYTSAVRTFGGVYRGQKPTVLVCFTEYASEDKMPLPV